jgi:membrane-associated phospholipid phosphatase
MGERFPFVRGSAPLALAGALGASRAAAEPPKRAPSAVEECAASRASAAERMPSPIDSLGPDIARAAGGYQWLYLASAVAATLAMSPTGADHSIRVAVQTHLRVPAWGDAAYYGGYILPIVVPVSMYVTGLIADDHRTAGAGSAALQALALTEVVTVFLKVSTGRPFPLHGGDPDAPDRLQHPEYAHEWVPFGFDGRYAWPSGHTSAAFSIAASLTAYYDSWVVAAISYPVASAIAFGMLTGDRHWASDIVAGGLIGQGLGWSVGESFGDRARHRERKASRLHFTPLVGAGLQGIAVFGTL